MEWTRNKYNQQYESWMPWVEDKYLAWFGENKTSYVAKDNLSKTKITGNKDVDGVQDSVNNLVGNSLGKNGIGAPAGDLVSKEGFNRSERGGKGEKGWFK